MANIFAAAQLETHQKSDKSCENQMDCMKVLLEDRKGDLR
jgi:hypothetical protein